MFRGHSDASWSLETTLDCYVGSNLKLSFYYSMIKNILPEIETFTIEIGISQNI